VNVLMWLKGLEPPKPIWWEKGEPRWFWWGLVGVFLLACSMRVFAASSVSLDLQEITLKELARLCYGEILQESYVLDGAVQDDQRPVSLNLRNVAPVACEVELAKLLEVRGLQAVVSHGVLVVGKKVVVEKDDDREVYVYRPAFRSVQYLLDMVAALFPAGSFVSQRGGVMGIGAVAGAASVSGVAGQVQGATLAGAVPSVNQGMNKTLDTDADVVVFRGRGKQIEQLKKVLGQVDVSAGEVVVNAVIYEVQTTRGESSAVDLVLNVIQGKLGLVLSGGAAAAGSRVFGNLGNKVNAVFSALSSDSRFKVVSAPRVRVRSGAAAHFSVGSDVPVLGAVTYPTAGGAAVQSVNYVSAGVIFDVTPVLREGAIDLKVGQQISDFVATDTGVNGSPTLNKRALSTEVSAVDGDLIVIGGLDEKRGTQSSGGMPFLPAFLRSTSDTGSGTEIVLTLHVQRI